MARICPSPPYVGSYSCTAPSPCLYVWQTNINGNFGPPAELTKGAKLDFNGNFGHFPEVVVYIGYVGPSECSFQRWDAAPSHKVVVGTRGGGVLG